MAVYILPFCGFFGGAGASPKLATALTLAQYTLFVAPILALSFYKLKSFKPPRPMKSASGSHSVTYFMTLAALLLDMLQLSSMCLSRAAPDGPSSSLFSFFLLETGVPEFEAGLFIFSVGAVIVWLATLNTASAATRKAGENRYTDLLSVLTCAMSALSITTTLSIMRSMECGPLTPFAGGSGACWRGSHALVLFFGFFALQHLLVSSVLFTSVLGVCSSLQPYFLPYFSTFDRVAKFLVCASVVLAGDGRQHFAPMVGCIVLSCGLLLIASRRGDTSSTMFTLRGPCSAPSLNPYVTLQLCGVLWAAAISLLLRANVMSELWGLFVVSSGWALMWAKLLSTIPSASGMGAASLGLLAFDPENQGMRLDSAVSDVSTQVTQKGNDEEMWHACDDQEAEEEYCPGGYHRVHLGDVYNNRYKILCKLGWGKFSTVWLVQDKSSEAELSALKICKSTQEFGAACMYEVGILKKMASFVHPNKDYVVRLCDYFEIEGPNGTHVSMVLEPLGPNLLKLITSHNFRGIDANIVKVVTTGILRGLQYLEEAAGVIHTDLKPENILLEVRDESVILDIAKVLGLSDTPGVLQEVQQSNDAFRGVVSREANESLRDALHRTYKVKITDFGAARWVTETCPVMIVQTREYRCPEVILGIQKLTTKIDMWSLACIVFELMTGDFLFDPKRQKEVEMDIYHWMLFRQILGDVPEPLSKSNGKYANRFFDSTGQFRYPSSLPATPLHQLIQMKYSMEPQASQRFADFLLPMIEFDPTKRPSPSTVLTEKWLEVLE